MSKYYLFKSHFIGFNPLNVNKPIFNVTIELKDKVSNYHCLTVASFTFDENSIIDINSDVLSAVYPDIEDYINDTVNNSTMNEIRSDFNEYIDYKFTDKTHDVLTYAFNDEKNKNHYLMIKVFQSDFNNDDLLNLIIDKHNLNSD